MSNLIKKYISSQNIQFNDLCLSSSNTGDVSVVSRTISGYVRLNKNGLVKNSLTYTYGDHVLSLFRIEKAIGTRGELTGDFVALGSTPSGTGRNVHHIILRLKPNGEVIWAKRIFSSRTRYSVSFQCDNDLITIAAWNGSGHEKVEYSVIKLNGSFLFQSQLSFGGDDQVFGHKRYDNTEFFLGNSSHKAFLIKRGLDDSSRTESYTFPHQDAKKRLYFHQIEFPNYSENPEAKFSAVIVGTESLKTDNDRSTIILNSDLRDRYSGIRVKLSSGSDEIISFRMHHNHFYLLGRARGGKGESYVLKFDLRLNLLWRKEIKLGKVVYLTGLEIEPGAEANASLIICGMEKLDSGKYHSIFIRTDAELSSCKTKKTDVPQPQVIRFPVERKDIKESKPDVKAQDIKLQSYENPLEIEQICPEPEPLDEKQPKITEGKWLQSPYLYLQSAGSTGTIASRGHFLRWLFLRNLGENHFPKGDYSQSTTGFNKPDDYVHIWRAPYKEPKPYILDFESQKPDVVDDAQRRWVYIHENAPIYLEFSDQTRYDETRSQFDPENNALGFLKAYGDARVSLKLLSHLAYRVDLESGFSGTGELMVECFSKQGDHPDEDEAISHRQTLDYAQSSSLTVTEENICTIEFQSITGYISRISAYLYSELLENTRKKGLWTKVGRYGLSTDTNLAYQRLEDNGNVDARWKKFHGDHAVNIQNYKSRWTGSPDSLQAGITEYLTLSETDPKAIKVIKQEPTEFDLAWDLAEASDNDNTNQPTPHEMEWSFHDLLTLASMDFHNARTMGVGTIDHPTDDENQPYIYLASYNTEALLDDGSTTPTSRQHLYLSLPTSLKDERLPREIKTKSVQYGLKLDQGTTEPVLLTDQDGYPPFDMVRYINVHASLHDVQNRQGFMAPATNFSLSSQLNPVFAHLLYKESGESEWRQPGLSIHPDFSDTANPAMPEVIPLSLRPEHDQPIFTHEETEEGKHIYKAIPVDLFSRGIDVGNEVETNYTRFTKPNTLLPPHNVQVQIIQPEEKTQLLLTTEQEQNMLAVITDPDKTLVRVSFDYNHVHDLNYAFADTVEFFHRSALPRETAGKIQWVNQTLNDPFVQITTDTYVYDSVHEEAIPKILPAHADNFVGGILVTNSERYEIEEVIVNTSGLNPSFKLRKLLDRDARKDNAGNNLTSVEYLDFSGQPGDRFVVIENLAKASSWGIDNPLKFVSNIGDDSNPHWKTDSESYLDDSGKLVNQLLRGFWDSVYISKISGNDGEYKISFDNLKLPHHPQFIDFNPSLDFPLVDYYKGVVRVPMDTEPLVGNDNNTQRIELNVYSIDNIGSSQTLVLRATIRDTDKHFRPPLGQTVRANYYPGYRAYLLKDDQKEFNENSLFPESGEMIRKSLLALRSVDTKTLDNASTPYASDMGVPNILFAVEVIEAVPPAKPEGSKYVNPPDLYAKSSYSFTTKFKNDAFGGIFYRANTLAILSALYSQETLAAILEVIPKPSLDKYYVNRIQDIFDPDDSKANFLGFLLGDSNYRLPKPDNELFGFADNTVLNRSKVREVAYSLFVPLTEQPLILSQIETGSYIPKNKPQTIRDKYGEPLSPGHNEYDLAPMAKKTVEQSGDIQVQFTDFSADGDMSDSNSYLYMVRGMGNRMDLSDPSGVLGPVYLVNKTPPETPVIQKIASIVEDEWLGTQPAVEIYLHEYPDSVGIKYIELLRTTSPEAALSPRKMDSVGLFELSDIESTEGILKVFDDFSDLDFPPFAEPLFYKVVAQREISYENHLQAEVIEKIPSKPSQTLMTTIVDTLVPEGPALEKTVGIEDGEELRDLRLEWSSTVYNGKYYLQQQNEYANWELVTVVESNDDSDLFYEFPTPLNKTDEDGDTIYLRFRVLAENSSGVLGHESHVLTI